MFTFPPISAMWGSNLNLEPVKENEWASGMLALMIAIDTETNEVFHNVLEFAIDDDGTLSFDYLAVSSENLSEFLEPESEEKRFRQERPNEGESYYAFLKRLETLPNVERREVMIGAGYLRWESRGSFEYNEKTGEVRKAKPIRRGSKVVALRSV